MSAMSTEPWITTLIQIGIPSLVTMGTLFFNYRLGKASHQKDKDIARLASDSERRKLTNERKAKLITEITAALAEVENAIGAHSGIFRRTNIEDPSESITPSKELQDSFAALSAAIDKCCGARTATYLLGNSHISALFEQYLQDNFQFQKKANPLQETSPVDLTESFNQLSCRRIELLGLLSELYLDENSK